MNRTHICAGALACTCLAPNAIAQGPIFQTPGTPSGAESGQSDRFSNDFNPAFSLVIDVLGSYTDSDDADVDGINLNLRSVELTGAAYIDPGAWAWVAIIGDAEDIAIEEAAVIASIGGNSELRAGRFFVDFGKQMQAHIHDLRTVDRPLVLRSFLGEELPGNGLQWDNWFAAGDRTAVRTSLGMFQALERPADLAGLEDDVGDVEVVDSEGKDFDELAFTARMTGFRDIGEQSILQLGASGRFLPSFALEADGSDAAPVDGNSNIVYGFDLTYGWTSQTAQERLAVGGEYLIQTGDLSGTVVDSDGVDTIDVLNGDRSGFYMFADYGWNPHHSAGLQWSLAELAVDGAPEANEYDAYFTWHITDLRRLRFAFTMRDVEDGDDSVRFAIQFTNFLGVHAHGVNW